MEKKGLYEKGTVLIFKKEVVVIVFKENEEVEHVIEPGIQCVLHSLYPPKVDIVGDNALKVLRVELEHGSKLSEYFDVVKYRHLTIVK